VYRTTEDMRPAAVRDGVVEAVRFSAGVALAAIVFLMVAAAWLSTCGGSTFDTAACGAPQRTLLALGAPLILVAGGVRAFLRTYQLWRQRHVSWPWQGAGWFLMAAMVGILAEGMPLIAVP
jgi:hypothetical protein